MEATADAHNARSDAEAQALAAANLQRQSDEFSKALARASVEANQVGMHCRSSVCSFVSRVGWWPADAFVGGAVAALMESSISISLRACLEKSELAEAVVHTTPARLHVLQTHNATHPPPTCL